MAKKPEIKGAEQSAPEVKKDRVAIVMRPFVNSFQYAPHINEKCYKKWEAGQLVFNEAEIEELKALNAPIRVYVEDVD